MKQEEGVDLYRALTNSPFKRLYMWQAGHSTPGAENWQPLLDRFFDHTLMGVDNGMDTEAPVITEGRSATQKSTGFRTEAAWPPPATTETRVPLGEGSFTDLGASTETVSRGFLNLQYRNGLVAAEPIPPNQPIQATVPFKPQDQLFEAGHRIGVIVQGSNTVWALPDDPGATYTVNSSALLLLLS